MARNHCTSENSNHTETQKQSTTPKTITYERKCKECGRIFYSTAKNTQYCKSCSTLSRETQVKKNTETRRMKIGQTRNKITTGHAYNLDGKRVVIPNDYMLNAVSIFASYLGVSYGKFDSWKEKNMDEYLEWERQMLIDYVEQSKKCKMCGPRAPSRKVFEKYKR